MLQKLLKRKAAGFTLIELVLVLAIAGLILVIVFLAVAGAQRSRRDTGRKDVVNRTVAEYDQLVADGLNPVVNATLLSAVGTLPDGVTAMAAGTCPVAWSAAAEKKVLWDATNKQACIALEDHAVYSQNF